MLQSVGRCDGRKESGRKDFVNKKMDTRRKVSLVDVSVKFLSGFCGETPAAGKQFLGNLQDMNI